MTYSLIIYKDGRQVKEISEVPADTILDLLLDHNVEEVVEIKETEKVEGGRKLRFCKNCGKPGHRSDSCPAKKKIYQAPDEDEELAESDLIERIRELWVDEGMPSPKVCIELGISIAKLNSLIMRYKITRV